MVCNGIEIAGRRCGCQAGLCIPMAGEESEKYVEALKASGYTESFSEEEAVSSGIILEKNEVILSIAYSDGVLSVLITDQSLADVN